MASFPLTTSEANLILQSLPKQSPSMQSTKKYLQVFAKLKTKTQTEDLREILSKFSPEQIAILGSVLPTSVEEFQNFVGDCKCDDVGYIVMRIQQIL